MRVRWVFFSQRELCRRGKQFPCGIIFMHGLIAFRSVWAVMPRGDPAHWCGLAPTVQTITFRSSAGRQHSGPRYSGTINGTSTVKWGTDIDESYRQVMIQTIKTCVKWSPLSILFEQHLLTQNTFINKCSVLIKCCSKGVCKGVYSKLILIVHKGLHYLRSSNIKHIECKAWIMNYRYLKDRAHLSTFKFFIFDKFSCFIVLVVFLVIVQSSVLVSVWFCEKITFKKILLVTTALRYMWAGLPWGCRPLAG